MHFTTTTLTAVLLALRPVAADFLIFAGYENTAYDPAQSMLINFFNNPPSCNDFVNSVSDAPTPNNDASHDGTACDGCGGGLAPQDWDVTRFEIHDAGAKFFDNGGDEPHFSKSRSSRPLYLLGLLTFIALQLFTRTALADGTCMTWTTTSLAHATSPTPSRLLPVPMSSQRIMVQVSSTVSWAIFPSTSLYVRV